MKRKRRNIVNISDLHDAKRRKDAADDYLKRWYEFDAMEDKTSLEAKRIDAISSNLLHEWIGLYKRETNAEKDKERV